MKKTLIYAIIYLMLLGRQNMKYSSEMLRGNTETIILSILMNGDSYGYAVLKSINDRGGGIFDLKDATIYTTIKRLESDGLITTYWGEETIGARRKYYHITDKGKEYYMQKLAEWHEVNHILNKLITGGTDDE